MAVHGMELISMLNHKKINTPLASVVDPDPNVFGPRGAGSLHDQTRIGKKKIISTVFLLFMTLYLKNDRKVLQKVINNKNFNKIILLVS
jgi:hypothetical protein